MSCRITLPARTSRSSSTPQRWALPNRTAPVSAIRVELAAAPCPVASNKIAEAARIGNECMASSGVEQTSSRFRQDQAQKRNFLGLLRKFSGLNETHRTLFGKIMDLIEEAAAI